MYATLHQSPHATLSLHTNRCLWMFVSLLTERGVGTRDCILDQVER
eukprot:CAMPEP_0175955264 /NCGR_PEP_ID=MMETSP0108-20121206/32406_1 /TAXON_ID=195067 ORGANISM="Goniomonas pacifica, Strain CCMP1869" /NCGR_SAMPLE_ID=MMETSP0108 /ASSEMBLY_ACC=CAM_ASM_000204 /LENGTH=45 /DNA_ID= /DNA_START= /DNA_END= /DNA_ORIENTATION=